MSRSPLFLRVASLALAVHLTQAATCQEPKPVFVAQVTQAEINSGQRVIGTVNPLRTSTIGSALAGRVEKFLVNQGDAVKQNSPLAQLRTQTLEIELAAAEAELELAKQSLAELENGALPEEIAEAEANAQRAKAVFEYAQDNLKRIQSLMTRSAASRAELDIAREASDAGRFTLKASEANLKRIKDGTRIESIAQAKAQVDLQQQRVNLIKDRIKKSTIIAPFDGFIASEHTEVGAWISQGDPVAQVIQLDEVEVVASVTAEGIANLRIGDSVRVEFPELPDELLTGTIERIVPMAVSRSRTFPVHIKLQNRFRDGIPTLMAGMLARVDLPFGSRETLPLVPKDALVLNGNDRSVFVIDTNDKTAIARKVQVELGVAVKDRIQVRGDLKAGQLVVVAGNERLVPNSKVKVAKEKTPDKTSTSGGQP